MNLILSGTAMLVSALLSVIFFFFSKKELWESESTTSFECGYTSYFLSRFSFSIHYFIIALLFLFLDLELCMVMPYFKESSASMKMTTNIIVFLSAVAMGLIMEWKKKKLEWKF